MRTVSEVAELAGVTVRTLHHYHEVGFVVPSGRSEAGYRLYATSDLERLQLVLFYRELGFGLAQIKDLLDSAEVDRGQALRSQRGLLAAQAHRLDRIIAAVDAAIHAYDGGATMSDEAMFEVFGEQQRELQAEAAVGTRSSCWPWMARWASPRRCTVTGTDPSNRCHFGPARRCSSPRRHGRSRSPARGSCSG